MFEAWGRFIFRRRRVVLLIAGLAVIAAAVWGTGVFGKLQSAGGFAPPASQSQREADLAARTFGQDAADVVLLYSSKDMTVTAPAYQAAVTSSLARLRGKVVSAQTYWSTGSARFAGASGHETFALVQLRGGGDAAKIKSWDAIAGQLTAPGLNVRAGGQIPTEAAINKQVT